MKAFFRKKRIIEVSLVLALALGFGAIAWSTLGGVQDPLLEWESIKVNANLGYAVSKAGDFDGDGYADIVLGAPAVTGGFTPETTPSALIASGNNGWIIEDIKAVDPSSKFGFSVSGGGDVNADGKGDVIIGAPGSPQAYGLGRVFIYTNTDSYEFTAQYTVDDFGYSVSNAGDINNDGFDDVIVGAPSNYEWFTGIKGSFKIFSGAKLALGQLASQFFHEKSFISDGLGYSVSGGGDFNGDGNDDALVGTRSGGDSIVYFGNGSTFGFWKTVLPNNGIYQSVAVAGDINGDGFDDAVINNIAFSPVKVYFGQSSGINTNFIEIPENGARTVASAGDVNGDGKDEIVIGSYGEVTVYTFNSGAGDFDCIARFNESQLSENFGKSVSGAGDINQDGFDDIIIGAPSFDWSVSSYVATDSGRAAVYRIGGAENYGEGGPNQTLSLTWDHVSGTTGAVTVDAGAANANKRFFIAASLGMDSLSLPGGAIFLVDSNQPFGGQLVYTLNLDGNGKLVLEDVDLANLGVAASTDIFMQAAILDHPGVYHTSPGLQLTTF